MNFQGTDFFMFRVVMLPQLPITCFEVWRMNEDFVFESSLKNVKQSDKNTFSALKKK